VMLLKKSILTNGVLKQIVVLLDNKIMHYY
jgi:hypothetical protein